jgi:hypothetical protein
VVITVYPNPAHTALTISGTAQGQTIDIYNYMGQKISSLIVEGATQQLDLSTYEKGIYLVQVIHADGLPGGMAKVVKE